MENGFKKNNIGQYDISESTISASEEQNSEFRVSQRN